tara:strand:- start:2176 stop:2592 length:417 start_codon:yes stop_codon:yes gene_type:complete
MNEIKQFKLTNGDELVCEVVEWADEEYTDIIVRRAYTIHTSVEEESHRYHSFRPWMAMQEGNDMLITLSSQHIISEANPALKVLKFYRDAVDNSELTDKEMDDKVKKYIKKMKDMLDNEDDQVECNIVSFPSNKDTIH